MADDHFCPFFDDIDQPLLRALQATLDSLLESPNWHVTTVGDTKHIDAPVLHAMRVLWANGGDPVYLDEDALECYAGRDAMERALAGLLAYSIQFDATVRVGIPMPAASSQVAIAA